jgi:transcriptional regulator with XRE-family HTH domain
MSRRKLMTGRKIKDLRESKGLTQRELSEGICDRTFISKIEKGEVHPSADILNKICFRLNIPINELEYYTSETHYEYTKQLKEDIRRAMQERDYKRVKILVNNSTNAPLYQNGIMKAFLLWNKGVADFYLNNNQLTALEDIHCALDLIKNITHIDACIMAIEMKISLGVINIEIGDYLEAEHFFLKAKTLLENSQKLGVGLIKIKLFYNFSTFYIRKCDYKEALKYTQIGIMESKALNKLNYLGDLYFHNGLCKALLKMDGYIEDFENAKVIFKIQGNNVLYEYVLEKMRKYVNKDEVNTNA